MFAMHGDDDSRFAAKSQIPNPKLQGNWEKLRKLEKRCGLAMVRRLTYEYGPNGRVGISFGRCLDHSRAKYHAAAARYQRGHQRARPGALLPAGGGMERASVDRRCPGLVGDVRLS